MVSSAESRGLRMSGSGGVAHGRVVGPHLLGDDIITGESQIVFVPDAHHRFSASDTAMLPALMCGAHCSLREHRENKSRPLVGENGQVSLQAV